MHVHIVKHYNCILLCYNSMKTTYQPEWGPRHNAVVEKYEAKKKAGTMRKIVVVTKDQ